MGMGDLGEPPVSDGFSNEVEGVVKLVRLQVQVLVELEGRKPNHSFLLANAVSHVNPVVVTFSEDHNKPTCYLLKCPKVNATTANASHRRRKQYANFACTVPGYGFMRGFNLKGHLRRHFEENPYK